MILTILKTCMCLKKKKTTNEFRKIKRADIVGWFSLILLYWYNNVFHATNNQGETPSFTFSFDSLRLERKEEDFQR